MPSSSVLEGATLSAANELRTRREIVAIFRIFIPRVIEPSPWISDKPILGCASCTMSNPARRRPRCQHGLAAIRVKGPGHASAPVHGESSDRLIIDGFDHSALRNATV